MKNKINRYFVVLTFLGIVATLIFTTIVYYHLFQKEVLESLMGYAKIIQNTKDLDVKTLKEDSAMDNIRITVIAKDGTVLYDTDANVDSMDNHGDRPEIERAFQKGEGSTIRQSETMDKSNFYYALRLKSGEILRVSKETGSIWQIYENAIPLILLIFIVLFGICIVFGHFLTKSIVEPIEKMGKDLDQVGDITTYKELTPFVNLIQTQHEDIIKSSRMRQDFTANVTHELKTPLTVISGYSELIENGMATEGDVTRFAGEIHRNSKRLLTLINDILKLSELDSSSEDAYEKTEVDLYIIAESCIDMLEVSAQKHNVTLHLAGEHYMVMAHRDLMEELMYNLCDNAIRYNRDNGNVWVEIWGSLVVKDDGIGISKEYQERIFERFFRVDKSRSKKTGGTGLGLAIVKHIVEIHDAQLNLTSELGKGTRVEIQFPEIEQKQ